MLTWVTRYFRNKVDPEVAPVCRFCLEADETFIHIANECPRFHLTRREYFQDLLIINDHQWSVDKLLEFSFTPGVNEALEGDTRIELEPTNIDTSTT